MSERCVTDDGRRTTDAADPREPKRAAVAHEGSAMSDSDDDSKTSQGLPPTSTAPPDAPAPTATQRRPVHPETDVLSRGFDPRLSVGSVRPAVFRSSTYVFSSPEAAERAFAVALGKDRATPDEDIELIYSRLSHPNAEILEDQIVPLDRGATGAVVFNSGMAAIATVLQTLCRPGSAIVHTVPVYGGTHHLLYEMLVPWGINPVAIPAGDGVALERAIRETTNLRVVLIETPANPTLRMTDLAAAGRAARERSEPPCVVVDNTFLGPVFQHPLELGADVCVYSATKYLAGFSDMLGGVATARDPGLIDQFKGTRTLFGNILQPDEAWLLESRLPTLSLRMNHQSQNAVKIVEALAEHPKVDRIHYPTLFEEPDQRRIFESQCDQPGAVFSLELVGGKKAAFDFLRQLRITRNAVSLGGMESLACHPATTTASEMSDEALIAAGIVPGMVRLSVGVEDWRDLLSDYTDALDNL
jgi:cystathionine beta-lyase/cystathionine gamma-synthase